LGLFCAKDVGVVESKGMAAISANISLALFGITISIHQNDLKIIFAFII
jgi:hypothetical protein